MSDQMKSSSSAQSTPIVSADAGFYRFRMGSFEVTIITDGSLSLPSAILGINAPEGALTELLASHYLPVETFVAPIHCMLVNTGNNLVLIDTGLGGVALPGFETASGKLLPTLALLGIDPANVDTVILTHAHPDHIGGMINEAGNSNFPNATYHINQVEWDFWTRAAMNTDNALLNYFATVAQRNLLARQDRIQKFDGAVEIVPGIMTVPASGHTPGHCAVKIGPGNDRILNIADTTLHYVIGLEEPGWHNALEIDPKQVEESRINVLTLASSERMKIFGYHFPFPGIGYVAPDDISENWKFLITG